MIVIKPNDNLPEVLSNLRPFTGQISIFLAGSIEMGNCEDWQSKVQELLKDEDVIIFDEISGLNILLYSLTKVELGKKSVNPNYIMNSEKAKKSIN